MFESPTFQCDEVASAPWRTLIN